MNSCPLARCASEVLQMVCFCSETNLLRRCIISLFFETMFCIFAATWFLNHVAFCGITHAHCCCCFRQFTSIEALTKHEKRVHSKPLSLSVTQNSSNFQLHCPQSLCEAMFVQPFLLFLHRVRHHQESRCIYNCSDCAFISLYADALRRHRQAVHSCAAPSPFDKPLSCNTVVPATMQTLHSSDYFCIVTNFERVAVIHEVSLRSRYDPNLAMSSTAVELATKLPCVFFIRFATDGFVVAGTRVTVSLDSRLCRLWHTATLASARHNYSLFENAQPIHLCQSSMSTPVGETMCMVEGLSTDLKTSVVPTRFTKRQKTSAAAN